jgi:hypothetical protein
MSKTRAIRIAPGQALSSRLRNDATSITLRSIGNSSHAN